MFNQECSKNQNIFLQFITNKEDPDNKEDDPLMKLKSMAKGIVKCRICKEDHWTTQCPYKDTLLPVQEALNKVKLFNYLLLDYSNKQLLSDQQAEEKKAPPPAAAPGGAQAKGGKEGSAYVAPALRDGGNRKGETMMMGRRSKNSFSADLFYFFI